MKLWGFLLLELAAVGTASGVVFFGHRLGAGFAEAHGRPAERAAVADFFASGERLSA